MINEIKSIKFFDTEKEVGGGIHYFYKSLLEYVDENGNNKIIFYPIHKHIERDFHVEYYFPGNEMSNFSLDYREYIVKNFDEDSIEDQFKTFKRFIELCGEEKASSEVSEEFYVSYQKHELKKETEKQTDLSKEKQKRRI